MTYEKQNFKDGEVLKAEHLNHIEEGIGQLSDSIDNLKENGVSGGTYSSIEPKYDDIPKVFFDESIPQTKNDVVTKFKYFSKTKEVSGYAKFKAQGNSSLSYPKKNVTVKMYEDEACENKLKVDFKGWGEQTKHVYKANWIDLTHARNIVSARIWADIVKSRSAYESYPNEFKTSPNQGAVDGFPIKVYSQGIYQGRYTLNIPKDAWTFNMNDELDNHCILCGEGYVSGCFREASVTQWTDEVHSKMPTSISTRWIEIISFVMNSSDDEFKTNLSNYFYVDSLIDYFIYGMVSCGLDAFGKNQIYATYDGQKWIASMYDMDSTWGLYYTGSKFVSASYSREQYEDFVNTSGNLLYIRLAQLFVDEIKARYEVLKKGVLSIPNIINHFERFTDITPLDLVKEDYASTTGSGEFTGIPSKDTNNIQQIRKYVVDRYSFVDGYIASLTDSGGEDTPTEATLSSISATYNGGEVLVGTDIDDLTGITVTGTYSDSTTKNIIDYTLSGTINEGSNTITVSYQGKTTTFTVVGYVEVEEPTYEAPTDYVYSLQQETTFNGTSDYVDTGVKLYDVEKDYTLLVDFTQGSTSGQQMLVHCMKEVNPYPGLALQKPNGNTVIDIDGVSVRTNAASKEGTHNKIVLVLNTQTKQEDLYTNSPLQHLSSTYSSITTFDKNLLLGCYQEDNGTKGRYWNGTIHNCKVWNRALTDEEILVVPTHTWSEQANKAYGSDGVLKTGQNYVTTKLIKVPSDAGFVFENIGDANYTWLTVYEYDENMNFIRKFGDVGTASNVATVTTSSTKYVHLSAYPNDNENNNNPSEQLKFSWFGLE